MTIDSEIRDRLHAAVDETSAPPAFAAAVLAGGRARRRRRHAAGGLAATLVVTLGASLLVRDAPTAGPSEIADSGPRTFQASMDWARSLPEGEAAGLPFFGEGGLHDGDQVVPVPDTVARWLSPEVVDGGWLVGLDHETELAPAVLTPEGALRILPPYPFPERAGGSKQWVVSRDGTQVAYGDRVIDLATLDTTRIPHDPIGDSAPGHLEKQRLLGWTEDGLAYEGSPSEMGMGTTWLLRGDGSTVELDPKGAMMSTNWPADIALIPSEKGDQTCVQPLRLIDAQWVEEPASCHNRALSQFQDVSPDGRWLLAGDLPQLWDLREGRFSSVDVPAEIVADWGEFWPFSGFAGWESTDTLLLPVLDQGFTWHEAGSDEQQLQVVRCTMSTGACERAGEEQTIRDEVVPPSARSTIVEFASRQ